MPTQFAVTSTGKNCPWARHCIYSVAAQDYEHSTHHYIAADEDTFSIALSARAQIESEKLTIRYSPATIVENVYTYWQTLSPEVVIVWLDGDDWLIRKNVLTLLDGIYRTFEPWLTYGSFVSTTRSYRWPNLGTRYHGIPPRRDVWRASHLKTFRAGLVQQVKKEDLLRPDGSWTEYCTDQVFMLPMLEMAGQNYAVYREPLMQYNIASSFLKNQAEQDPKKAEAELEELTRIRALPPYQPLARRPF